MKISTKRGRCFLAAIALCLTGGALGLTPGVASAAFSDCTPGHYCLWTNPDSTGTQLSFTTAFDIRPSGYANERSFGNVISNRCLRMYNASNVFIGSASFNTGNAWGSNQTVGRTTLAVGSC